MNSVICLYSRLKSLKCSWTESKIVRLTDWQVIYFNAVIESEWVFWMRILGVLNNAWNWNHRNVVPIAFWYFGTVLSRPFSFAPKSSIWMWTNKRSRLLAFYLCWCLCGKISNPRHATDRSFLNRSETEIACNFRYIAKYQHRFIYR